MESFNLSKKEKKDSQLEIDFNNKSNDVHGEFEAEYLKDILGKLNEKYPYAKINPSLIKQDNKGGFIVNGEHMTLGQLEEYFSGWNDTYNPNTEDSRYR